MPELNCRTLAGGGVKLPFPSFSLHSSLKNLCLNEARILVYLDDKDGLKAVYFKKTSFGLNVKST